MKNVLVSVIVPVYNVEKYLADCVDSIISQTYGNIEIILVDDGSQDKSGLLCDEYSKLDNRIITIHKKNGGLSTARNTGIDIAKGDYILFVDSDDFINRNMIKDMISTATNNGSSLVVSPISNDYAVVLNDEKNDDYQISQKELLFSFFSEGAIPTSASGKLYASDLWEKERFPEGKIFEDYATIYKIVLSTNKIRVLPNHYYFYRPNPNGITGSAFSKKKLEYFTITEDIKKHLTENNTNEYEDAINNRTTRYAISFFRDMSRSQYCDLDDIERLVIIIRKGILKYLYSHYSIFSKLYGLLISVSPRIAYKVFR